MPGEHGVLVHAVPAFSIREALNYLSGRLTTDPDQRNGAIDLASALGCEPAALAQASAVIISSGIRCREYRDYFIQRQAQPAAWRRAAGGGGADLDGVGQSCRAAGARRGHLAAAGAGRAAGRSRHPRYRAHRPVRLPVPGRRGRRAPAGPAAGLVGAAGPGAGRAGGRRCGQRPAGGLGEPGAAGRGSRGRAAGAAGPGGPRGGRCAGAGVASVPGQVMAGRRAAVVRGEPAAGRRGRAVGRRLSCAAAGHGAEPGGRRAGRPRAGLVAGAGRGQRAAPGPGPPGHPGGRWPAGCRAAGRRAGQTRR